MCFKKKEIHTFSQPIDSYFREDAGKKRIISEFRSVKKKN